MTMSDRESQSTRETQSSVLYFCFDGVFKCAHEYLHWQLQRAWLLCGEKWNRLVSLPCASLRKQCQGQSHVTKYAQSWPWQAHHSEIPSNYQIASVWTPNINPRQSGPAALWAINGSVSLVCSSSLFFLFKIVFDCPGSPAFSYRFWDWLINFFAKVSWDLNGDDVESVDQFGGDCHCNKVFDFIFWCLTTDSCEVSSISVPLCPTSGQGVGKLKFLLFWC